MKVKENIFPILIQKIKYDINNNQLLELERRVVNQMKLTLVLRVLGNY